MAKMFGQIARYSGPSARDGGRVSGNIERMIATVGARPRF